LRRSAPAAVTAATAAAAASAAGLEVFLAQYVGRAALFGVMAGVAGFSALWPGLAAPLLLACVTITVQALTGGLACIYVSL
jgi:hypothetical protein